MAFLLELTFEKLVPVSNMEIKTPSPKDTLVQ